MIDRRSFLRMGLAAIAAPAIVKASNLMAIKAIEPVWEIRKYALGFAITEEIVEPNVITAALMRSLQQNKITASARVLDQMCDTAMMASEPRGWFHAR